MSLETLDILRFPLHGVRLIEASAGTGKTYTIAALYVRLVLGHGDHQPALSPPDILVVTFTEAATQELRDRIRQRLTQAARFFRGQTAAADPFLSELRSAYESTDWPACAWRLETAARWMDEAAIYTIHGWCNRMLQQHALASGSAFHQSVEDDDGEHLLRVARDYWRSQFYPLADALACDAVLQLATTPEDLLQKVRPLLSETEALGLEAPDTDIASLLQSVADWSREQQRQLASARLCWYTHRADLSERLQAAVAQGWLNGKKYPADRFADRLAAVHAWSAGGSLNDDKQGDNNQNDNNQDDNTLTDDNLVKFARTRLQAALNKKHQHQAAVFDHPALMALDDYAALLERKPDIASPLRLHALHWMRQRYDTEKRRLSTLSFDDMLTRLDRALASTGGDKLATAIRQQYPVALIDEFQDTDPLQYRIFATLYPADADSDSHLTCLMIGDPKQAIYSFRGGDIHSYLRAYRATVGKHYTLNVNYRSTQGLVAAVNRVFAHADARNPQGAFGFAAGENDPLPFHPVAAQGRKAHWIVDGQPATPLTLWHWHSEDAVASPVYCKHMAEVCASDIVRLLNQAEQGVCGFAADDGRFQALKASDIAILVRSGREARAIRLALYRRGLKSVYLSERDSIYATPQAQDLVFWLSAMAEPRNERAVRAALATATLALDYPTLLALADDEERWEWHLEAFQRYQASWRNDGILPALRQMIADYRLHGRLMAAADGERCLTNLLHLAELLQHASGQLDGEQALIRHLSDAIQTAQNGRSSNDGILRLESDAQLIKVVTIHKAKGLEYPLVFLPFICSYREAGSQSGIYRYHNDDLAVCIALTPNDDIKTIKAISERERMQEDLRLLYVALTRGQYACWLGIAPIKVLGKQCQLAKSAIGHVLDWQPGTAASQLADKLQALQGDCSAIAIVPLPQPTADSHQPLTSPPVLQAPRHAVRRIADDWWIASYSALNIDSERLPAAQPEQAADTPQDDKHRDETDPDTPLAATDGIHALPRGAAAGVLIHELLEHCARRGFAKVAADMALQAQLIAPILQITPWQRHEPALTSALQAWLGMNLLGDAALEDLVTNDTQLARPRPPGEGWGEGGIQNCCLRSTPRLVDLDNGHSQNHYQAEMEFLIGMNPVDLHALDALIARHVFPGRPRPRLQPGQLHGLLKGFIDLVFVHDDSYYVLDYKFNMLGSGDAAYTHEALVDALLQRRYDLQAALYLLALHRLLQTRLGDGYDIGRHLGGAVYLFLRGVHAASQGRLLMPADIELVLAMDALFLAEVIV